jgi:hypothetical protein
MQSATLGLRWALPAGASAIVVALEIRRR